MPYPISINKNNYNDNPKSSTVYTPTTLAHRLFSLVLSYGGLNRDPGRKLKVLDPAVGTGNLLAPFMAHSAIFEKEFETYGIDIVDKVPNSCDYFHKGKFEEWPNSIEWFELGKEFIPDLIICNPPFNGCSGRQLYPEVFLRHIGKLFGYYIPTIMVVPMGFRLNQRKNSTRWKYLRDNWEISSIMTLPIDMFGDVLFHAEIIFFNFPHGSLNPHYFYE